MSSGIKVSDEVKQAYTKVAMTTKSTTKLKYAVFTFSEDLKQIVVAQQVEASADDDNDYDGLLSSLLPEKDVLMLAYDFGYINKEGTSKSDVIFLSWNPEACTLKKKMLLAASLNTMRNNLKLNSRFVIEAGDTTEASSAAVLEKIGGTPLKK